jgi:excisionase family DNA binding protein
MEQATLAPLDINQRYSLAEAAKYLRQSRSKTYSDIQEGKLAVIKDGRRRYVPGQSIAARSSVDSAA